MFDVDFNRFILKSTFPQPIPKFLTSLEIAFAFLLSGFLGFGLGIRTEIERKLKVDVIILFLWLVKCVVL